MVDQKPLPPNFEEIFRLSKHPEIEKIVDEFFRSFNANVPETYGAIIGKCGFAYQRMTGIFQEVKNRERCNDPAKLRDKIYSVKEKCCAVYYHYDNSTKLQKKANEYIDRLILKANEIGVERHQMIGLSLKKLKLEYEAFIFQCGSCLDHFCESINYAFGFYSPKLTALERNLDSISHKNHRAKLISERIKKDAKFHALLHELLISKSKSPDSFQCWSDRDKIAHSGEIRFFELSINLNPDGEPPKVFHLARTGNVKPPFNQQDIAVFMKSFMDELFRFIEDIYGLLFEDFSSH